MTNFVSDCSIAKVSEQPGTGFGQQYITLELGNA